MVSPTGVGVWVCSCDLFSMYNIHAKYLALQRMGITTEKSVCTVKRRGKRKIRLEERNYSVSKEDKRGK